MSTNPEFESIELLQDRPIVLLVDDDPRVTAALERTLRNHAEVISTNNGRAAYKAATRCPNLALMVLDVTMPDYDSLELLEDLKSANIFPPLAIFSGWNAQILKNVADIAKIFGFPVMGVFEKPLDGRALIPLLK